MNAIIEVDISYWSTGYAMGFGKPNTTSTLVRKSRYLWVKNTSTAGFADRERCDFNNMLFKYAGTKQSGFGTMHMLERIELTADENVALGLEKVAKP